MTRSCLAGTSARLYRAGVSTTTQTWGVEPVGVWNIYRAEPGSRACWSLDFLAGYRYLQIKEETDHHQHNRTRQQNRVADVRE